MTADIIITEFMDTAAVVTLKADFDVLYDPTLVENKAKLLTVLPQARALIVRNRTKVRQDILKAGANLICIGRLGVGLDNIDQITCQKRGIKVFPAIDANASSVAEYVLTTAMILLRNAYLRQDSMVAGNWPRQLCSGREINGKILGLVGFGHIAQLTAKKAKMLGMHIIAYDPFLPADNIAWTQVENMQLDALLTMVDVVSLHTPLTTQTKHLINKKTLSLMRNDAILINAARGGIVDEQALSDSLRNGEIYAAALDVFETEPFTKSAAEKFSNITNILLTPHIAGVSVESNVRVSTLIAKTVASFLQSS